MYVMYMMQTNVANIFAIGDVLEGRPELTPVAIQVYACLNACIHACSLVHTHAHTHTRTHTGGHHAGEAAVWWSNGGDGLRSGTNVGIEVSVSSNRGV